MRGRVERRKRAIERRRQALGVRLCEHAIMRLVEHGFSEDEVLLAVGRPEQTYPSGPKHDGHRRTYQRGRVAVVVDVPTRTVVTVLPRKYERWEHEPPLRHMSLSSPVAR